MKGRKTIADLSNPCYLNSESIVSLSSWFTHPCLLFILSIFSHWSSAEMQTNKILFFHNQFINSTMAKLRFRAIFQHEWMNAKLILTGSVECDGVVFTECICHYIKAIRHNVALKPKHKSHSCPLWFKLQRSHFHSVRWHLQNPKYNWLSSRV